MGVDYVARKSAKKRKKKERQAVGKDGVAQRERRRKKVRRLCQGVCYKPPEITDEDKRWSDDENNVNDAPDSDIEEAVARAQSQRGTSTSLGGGEEQPSRRKKQPKEKRKPDAGAGAKNSKAGLSTSVQLLDPAILAHNARQAALRKLPSGAKAEALERYPALLQACMLTQHHVEPTPVQDRCWPPALAGRDVQGVAEPGSGKTLAYLLPGLVKLQAEGHSTTSRPAGPAMIVLLPTRELAQQVAAQCRTIRAVTGFCTVCVFGGVPREEQAALLAEKRPHVLVATPGRLLDLVDGGELELKSVVRYLVLDEADKMLSLGFKPQLDRLYDLLIKPYDAALAAAVAAKEVEKNAATKSPTSKKQLRKGGKAAKEATKDPQKDSNAPAGTGLPGSGGSDGGGGGDGNTHPGVSSRPQVLLFSATMPSEVAAAAAHWLRRPEMVHVSAGGANSISRTITQVVHVCAEHKKPDKLLKHLAHIRSATPAGTRNPPRLLVFANRVKTVRFLATTLSREGYKVAQLHGQRSQTERNQAVTDFRSGKAQILIATDVAARGLDIRALPYVVNYDFPTRLETYVHRVGRTGRLAAYGHSYSFFTRNLAPLAPSLLELLQSHEQAVDPNLAALAAAWKVAEEKLGGAGAAAAAARLQGLAPEGVGEGGEEDEDDEGDAAAAGAGAEKLIPAEVLGAAEDLMEGLGQKDARAIAALLRNKLNRQQQREEAEEEAAANGNGDQAVAPLRKKARREMADKAGADTVMEAGVPESPPLANNRKKRAGDIQLVPTTKEQRRVQQQQQQESQGGGVEEGDRQAAFVAAAKFTGAMQGFVFKRGPMGLGYYPDKPLLLVSIQRKTSAAVVSSNKASPAVAAPAAAGAKGKDKQAGKSNTAPKAAKVEKAASAWGLPTRNKPIIPVRHSDFLSDSDEEDGFRRNGAKHRSSSDSESDLEDAAPVKTTVSNGGGGPRKGAVAAKGVAKGGQRGGGVGGSLPDEAPDGSDSDSGLSDGLPEEGGRALAKKKHKALPGRLRKKLAKARGAVQKGK